MGFNIGPKVIRAPKGDGSIHRAGNYRVHQFPARFVTDGLVGHFDAAHPDSYPLTGDKWHDLSGANVMGPGTFNNNFEYPTGNAISGNNIIKDNNVCLRFDGNISCNWSGGSTFPVLQTFTGEMWVRILGTSSGGYHVLFQKDGGYSGGMVYGIRATDARAFTSNVFWGSGSGESSASQSTTGPNVAEDEWVHVVTRFDENFTLRLFINGVDRSSTSGVADVKLPPLQVTGGGNIGTGDSRYCNADVALFRLYNRPLSADEIAQNYNAEKLRFHNYATTFTPSCSGNKAKVEVLAVAGGGCGGSYSAGGGGGAGGLVHNPEYVVTNNTAITVNVGSGGTGGDYDLSSTDGSDGQNTVFGNINAVGGGAGRTWSQGTSQRDGGSGGGWLELGNNQTDEASSGGDGTAGQGFKGGGSVKLGSNTEAGGGGGGAGGFGNGTGSQVGGATSTTASASGTNFPGNGGPGLEFDISGERKFYAGGGGGGGYSAAGNGGSGGSGVGGRGGTGNSNYGGAQFGQNGMPNTGSGGGGGGPFKSVGASGSNGIVIVRYPAEDYNAELLLIAGGGAGGGSSTSAGGGGGGGAGGLIYHSKFRIISGKNYTINIGAGGTCIQNSGGLQGKNSTFGDLVAVGGGGGDRGNGGTSMATSGGSGGGAGYQGYSESLHQGRGLAGQGHDGSKVIVTSPSSAGGAGGGGAGSPGLPNRPNHAGGYGGNGLTYSITGTAVEYARGGQGGGGSDNARANTGDGGDAVYAQGNGQDSVSGRGYDGGTGVLYIAYKGPQRGEGGTIDQTSRAGYTIHKFLTVGSDLFIG